MLLGGIETDDPDFHVWLNSVCQQFKSSILLNLFKVVDELNVHSKIFESNDIFFRCRKMSFSIYSSYPKALRLAITMHEKNIDAEITKRKKIYLFLAEKFGPVEMLPSCWTTTNFPYAVPIKGPIQFLQEMQNILRTVGIRAPINHFDYNLNNLDPVYEKSLILPCHSQLTDVQVEFIRNTIYAKLPSRLFSQ